MISRVRGKLESVLESRAVVSLQNDAGFGVCLEVLLPAYLGDRMGALVGQVVSFVVVCYLESPNQGATFSPKLLGFASESEKQFFELLTSIKGLGNRRALRVMAVEPQVIASAIASGDSRKLQELPEIGKKLAESLIHELSDKARAFAGGPLVEPKGRRSGPITVLGEGLPPAAQDAVDALVSLGESRAEAERLVVRALDRHEGLVSTDRIIAAALSSR